MDGDAPDSTRQQNATAIVPWLAKGFVSSEDHDGAFDLSCTLTGPIVPIAWTGSLVRIIKNCC
jgi:hypothetical protein